LRFAPFLVAVPVVFPRIWVDIVPFSGFINLGRASYGKREMRNTKNTEVTTASPFNII